MSYKLFSMRSTQLVSDFDFVPDGISRQQEAVCENCFYRWYRIDLDIARYSRKSVLPFLSEPTPSCSRKRCLIDDEIIRLLNQENLIKSGKKNEEK